VLYLIECFHISAEPIPESRRIGAHVPRSMKASAWNRQGGRHGHCFLSPKSTNVLHAKAVIVCALACLVSPLGLAHVEIQTPRRRWILCSPCSWVREVASDELLISSQKIPGDDMWVGNELARIRRQKDGYRSPRPAVLDGGRAIVLSGIGTEHSSHQEPVNPTAVVGGYNSIVRI